MNKSKKTLVDMGMFDSLKNSKTDEVATTEKAPLLQETKAPRDWYVCVRTLFILVNEKKKVFCTCYNS